MCRTVILNRGPHGPPGGNLQVLGGGGGDTEHLGNWGGMDPFGGNHQIAINSPGCSSGWRIVAASPVPSHPVHTKTMTSLYRPITSRHNDALIVRLRS